MFRIRKLINDGISLKSLYFWVVFIAVLFTVLVAYSTVNLSKSFRVLSSSVEEHKFLETSAIKMIDGSDYLTERVQRYAVTGEADYVSDYLTEALQTQRREQAIRDLTRDPRCSTALELLNLAMAASQHLMEREYYAMKLVASAKNQENILNTLSGITLQPEHQKLSADEKIRLAQTYVFDNGYYREKDFIRKYMNDSLLEIDRLIHETERMSTDAHLTEIFKIRLIISLMIVGILIVIILASLLGIRPLLKATDKIRSDCPLPVKGFRELRYMARAYNHMYRKFRNHLEHLNYKASHDELTGVYNRTGYELLVSALDFNKTYILLVDVDNFKNVNDTYGHDTGDKILIKIVQTLKDNFRSNDYICRIGGDEFVVFMVHSEPEMKELLSAKIEQINKTLADTSDGLPPISISVGVAFGTCIGVEENIIEKADQALYRIKRNGKNGIAFFEA